MTSRRRLRRSGLFMLLVTGLAACGDMPRERRESEARVQRFVDAVLARDSVALASVASDSMQHHVLHLAERDSITATYLSLKASMRIEKIDFAEGERWVWIRYRHAGETRHGYLLIRGSQSAVRVARAHLSIVRLSGALPDARWP